MIKISLLHQSSSSFPHLVPHPHGVHHDGHRGGRHGVHGVHRVQRSGSQGFQDALLLKDTTQYHMTVKGLFSQPDCLYETV